jgi:hypothetical protein
MLNFLIGIEKGIKQIIENLDIVLEKYKGKNIKILCTFYK